MKSIMVHAGSDSGFEGRLQVALDLARRFNGHLSLILPRPPQDYVAFDMFGGAHFISEAFDAAEKERAKMQDAAGKFEPLGFFRSNKGYLVNLEYVEGVKDGCCTIQGEALLISRARKNDFMTALAQYMGEH